MALSACSPPLSHTLRSVAQAAACAIGRNACERGLAGAQQGSTEITAGSVPMRSANVADSVLVSETVQVTEL